MVHTDSNKTVKKDFNTVNWEKIKFELVLFIYSTHHTKMNTSCKIQ